VERFVELILLNALLATGLAGAVALVTRWWRHPAIVHVLWLLVLAKLVTPALVPVALLPARPSEPVASLAAPEGEWAREGDATAGPVGGMPARLDSEPVRGVADSGAVGSGVAESGFVDVRRALVALDLTIAAALLMLAMSRLVRFRRQLAGAREASGPLRRRVVELARRLGLRHVPRVRIVDATVPPLVTPGLAGAEIVLPARLLAELSGPERDALLAHELAHVARGDAWVRPFELVVTALFWWHPVVWWARRRLRLAEETACDALVLRVLPGRGCDYAKGLLRTLEFLHDRAPAPALATGADTSHLEERLTMIANESSARPLPRFRRAALALAGLALLLLVPVARDSGAAVAETAAPSPPASPAPSAVPAPAPVSPVPSVAPAPARAVEPVSPVDLRTPAPRVAPEARLLGESAELLSEPMLRLREEEIKLRGQLRELEIRRAQIEHELQEMQISAQIDLAREEIASLEAADEKEHAAEMRRVLKQLEIEARMQRARAELETEHATAQLALEERIELLFLERDAAQVRAEAEKARAYEVQAREIELQMRRQDLQTSREQLELEAQEFEAQEAAQE